MMYLMTTDYEKFAFETKEDLNDFLATATLPDYKVEEVEATPAYERMAMDTRWRMM